MPFDPTDDADSGLGEADAFLLRLDEIVLPSDATGNFADAVAVISGQEPSLVEEEPPMSTTTKGRAREFSIGYAFTTEPEATSTIGDGSLGLAIVLRWDFDGQVASGADAVVVCHAAKNNIDAELRLEVVDALSRIGRVRLTWWHDSSMVDVLVPGGEFVVPDEPFVICASRELLNAEYHVRLFAAGADLGSTRFAAKNSTGQTASAIDIGCRNATAGVSRFFVGTIDAVHAMQRAITAEEAELFDWLARIGGPQGYVSARDAQASRPDVPGAWPVDPSSWVQREIAVEGAGLALVRRNLRRMGRYALPAKAWGAWLKMWEDALGVPPRPGDGVEKRRTRTEKKLRSVLSMSRADLQEQLAEALGYEDDPTLATVVEYDDEYLDAMTDLVKDGNGLYTSGHAHTAWLRYGNTHTAFTSPVGANDYLEMGQTGTDDLRYNGWLGQSAGAEQNSPLYLHYIGSGARYPDGGRRMWCYGELRAATALPTNDLLAGIVVGSIVDDEWLWLGVRYTGAQYDLISLKFNGTSLDTSFAVHATNIGSPARFFYLRHNGDGHNDLGSYGARQAATSGGLAAAAEYTITGGPSRPDYGGFGFVARGGAASIVGPTTLRFGEWWQRAPDGEAHTNLSIYRDPADAGEYDVLHANEILQASMLADRNGSVIDRQSGLSYANALALLDLDPLEH
jgi:hypothetical protein